MKKTRAALLKCWRRSNIRLLAILRARFIVKEQIYCMTAARTATYEFLCDPSSSVSTPVHLGSSSSLVCGIRTELRTVRIGKATSHFYPSHSVVLTTDGDTAHVYLRFRILCSLHGTPVGVLPLELVRVDLRIESRGRVFWNVYATRSDELSMELA